MESRTLDVSPSVLFGLPSQGIVVNQRLKLLLFQRCVFQRGFSLNSIFFKVNLTMDFSSDEESFVITCIVEEEERWRKKVMGS